MRDTGIQAPALRGVFHQVSGELGANFIKV